MTDNMKITLELIKTHLAEARELVGKTVSISGKPQKVGFKEFDWHFEKPNVRKVSAVDYRLDGREIHSQACLDFYKEYGYCIVMELDGGSAPFEYVKVQNSLQLNNEYDAVLTKDGVKVGCQMIPFDKVRELAKLVEEYKP